MASGLKDCGFLVHLIGKPVSLQGVDSSVKTATLLLLNFNNSNARGWVIFSPSSRMASLAKESRPFKGT